MNLDFLVILVDLAGTFAFAVSGALTAIRKRNDVYGVFILAVVTALGGGVLRDTMLGLTPPTAFSDGRYMAVALGAALITWFFHPQVEKQGTLIRIIDAIGLALFTATGAQITLQAGGSWYAAIGFGILTGTGGGMIRDVLAGEVPFVLQKEIYAVASLLGASVYVGWTVALGLPEPVGFTLGVLVCGIARVMAIVGDWHLPQIPPGWRGK